MKKYFISFVLGLFALLALTLFAPQPVKSLPGGGTYKYRVITAHTYPGADLDIYRNSQLLLGNYTYDSNNGDVFYAHTHSGACAGANGMQVMTIEILYAPPGGQYSIQSTQTVMINPGCESGTWNNVNGVLVQQGGQYCPCGGDPGGNGQ